jgi:hypothetical protein
MAPVRIVDKSTKKVIIFQKTAKKKAKQKRHQKKRKRENRMNDHGCKSPSSSESAVEGGWTLIRVPELLALDLGLLFEVDRNLASRSSTSCLVMGNILEHFNTNTQGRTSPHTLFTTRPFTSIPANIVSSLKKSSRFMPVPN